MHRLKKISLWTSGILGFMLSLYLAALLILPQFIDSESVKREIRNQFAQMVGGRINFDRLELNIWPRPHIEIRQVRITIPPSLNSTVVASKIYPKILPILTGQVEIAVVRFESPVLDLKLMDDPAPGEKRSGSFELMDLGRRVIATLAILPQYNLPDLRFEIRKGYFNLSDAKQKIFELREIKAVFKGPLNDRQLNLHCRSNLWQDVTMIARADLPALEGRGRIELKGFTPQKLLARMFDKSGWQITPGRSNLSIKFQTKLPDGLKADVAGSISYLNLQHGRTDVLLRGQRLKAGVEIDGDRLTLSILDLALAKPNLKISGQMQIASRIPGVRFRIKGHRIDVKSLRSALSGLINENAAIQNIFRIIPDGKIPLVTAEARGKTLSDLINPNNLAIRARVIDAKIMIPGLELELDDVSGNTALTGGVLQATNLAARLGHIIGQNGELDLDFSGDENFFQLAIGLQADLSHLPPVLAKWIKNETFRRELLQISRLSGNAAGILMLDNTAGDLRVQVKADIADLTARHRNVPLPVTISNGKITYDRNRIEVDNLQGKVGRSSFSNLTAGAYWSREPYLMVQSGTGRIDLAEIHRWISESKGSAGRLNGIESTSGALSISKLRLQGPLLRPKDWMFDLKGAPENLAVKLRASPGKIKANGGAFHAVDQALGRKIYLKDHNLTLLDSSINLSGTIAGYQTRIDGVDLALEGALSDQGANWIADIIDLPSGFKLRTPFSLSKTQLTWHSGEETTLSGDLAVQDGPNLTADVRLVPGRLQVKKLIIRDSRSRADMDLLIQSGKLFFSFKGNLQQRTLDGLLLDNQVLRGWIRGDLRAEIYLDRSRRSTANGKLAARGLSLAGKPAGLPDIKSLSIAGAKNKLIVNSAEMTWNDSHLKLAGKMHFKARDLAADFDIDIDEVNWEIWQKAFDQAGPDIEKQRSPKSRLIPVKGVIRLKADRFRYQNLIWSPWQADLSFNPNTAQLKVIEADLCGISTRADIEIRPPELALQVNPTARNEKLQKTLICLFGESYLADGHFNLAGDIKGRGAKGTDLMESLGGKVAFEARDGRIYRDPALKKTLALLNITEVFLGRIPDFSASGMSYKKLSFAAKFDGGKLVFNKMYMDSPAMKVTGRGTLDILTQEIDFNIIVAPLRTFDRILGIVPLVGGILQTILTVPVKVEGDLKNPQVTLMDPAVVGSELAEWLQDSIKNPIKLIYPGLK